MVQTTKPKLLIRHADSDFPCSRTNETRAFELEHRLEGCFSSSGLCGCRRLPAVYTSTLGPLARRPGSAQTALKQTITTMRVLVSIVMVLVPVTILATNDRAVAALPRSAEEYLGRTRRRSPAVSFPSRWKWRGSETFSFLYPLINVMKSLLSKFQPTTAPQILVSGGTEGAGGSRAGDRWVAGDVYSAND